MKSVIKYHLSRWMMTILEVVFFNSSVIELMSISNIKMHKHVL